MIFNPNELSGILLYIIKESFIQCYRYVLLNASFTEERVNDIIETCIENNKFYNLKTKKFENDNETSIINSAKTEIEIMKAVFSIIGILVTSNQFISKGLV